MAVQKVMLFATYFGEQVINCGLIALMVMESGHNGYTGNGSI
jgi:hypothetical protein